MKLLKTASLGIATTLLALGCSTEVDAAEHEIPTHLEARLNALDTEQRAFLTGEAVQRVVPNWNRLLQELGRREGEALQTYVSDLMDIVEAMQYQPDEDLAEVPMNLDSPSYNFTVRRPQELNEHRRDPGPITLSRYIRSTSASIPTFAGAPVAVTPEDLVAGEVEVAIMGIPLNMSSGWRDASNGPRAMRGVHGLGQRDMYSLLDPAMELNIVDYGDIARDNLSIERTVGHAREMVAEVAATGAIPMVVGGDQSMTFATVAGIADAHGDAEVALLHFGAHYNAARIGDHPLTDRQSIYRLIADGIVPGSAVVQVGLRGPEAGAADFTWLREQGVRYHTMAAVERHGWSEVFDNALAEVQRGPGKVYFSIDLSVLEPGIATAGRPVPGGLSMRELLPAVRRVCAETEVVGFELMDLAPMLDPTSVLGALNANYVMNACLAGMAMRKNGLTEPGYLHPLVVEHGQ